MKKSLFVSAALTLSLTFSNLPFQDSQQSVEAASFNKVNYGQDVIYQIMTDRFSDGNTSNNPTGNLFSGDCSNLRKYCGGDWQGIINKINDGYLTNMGVTALWISQPVENVYSVLNDAAGTTAYHGYWGRDFKKTNPYFGSMTDFQNLINTAHAKGIKVIIDFAPNHTSPASEDTPSYMENGKLYDNGTLVGGYTNDTKGLFHHNKGTNFSSIEDGIYRNLYDLADFNHQNPTVDTYFKNAIKQWLNMGIDGIRVDAVKHMPFGWQKTFMETINTHQPVFTFGEWFLGENEVDQNYYDFANKYGMSLLDFRYGQELRQVLRNNSDNWYGFDSMITETQTKYEQPIDQVTFLDNHDMDRFHTSGADTKKTDLALTVMLTSRGVPNIYYGTEQYMTGNGDPNNRGKMTSFNQTTKAYQIIKKLSTLRKTNQALGFGKTKQRWINNDVYVYERQFGNDVVLVAVNKSTSTSYNVSGAATSLPAGTYTDQLTGLLTGSSITVSGGTIAAFDLSPGEAAVYAHNGSSSTPVIGGIGPVMAKPSNTLTISGDAFGTSTGSVKIGTVNASVQSWSNDEIKVTVPAVAAGSYQVTVTNSSGTVSTGYGPIDILSGSQSSVRFLINNAYTSNGQSVYVVGNTEELGNWNAAKAVGPFYNQIIAAYPTWYYDISVPAGTALEFKFIKKDSAGNVVWESGTNHTFTTPSSGPGTTINNWQN
ncbi:alpha-amylase family glycosyl hydrolase [Fictibacillus sp. 18YEL24]|uniref:alpha-amylase family glycosyl hydrolase n=1 Tax=Fictibacillus sp. 18YEL24 TaxID=2745875 RepID=UPI0018CEE04B|nr:alpha-amylase family glycosyl hydrolase [Fictibacillus sp. 18YEL24]MBH0168907.1 IPT/TIG domain-containing protein [Fictibacillus sp. 18YEL24]